MKKGKKSKKIPSINTFIIVSFDDCSTRCTNAISFDLLLFIIYKLFIVTFTCKGKIKFVENSKVIFLKDCLCRTNEILDSWDVGITTFVYEKKEITFCRTNCKHPYMIRVWWNFPGNILISFCVFYVTEKVMDKIEFLLNFKMKTVNLVLEENGISLCKAIIEGNVERVTVIITEMFNYFRSSYVSFWWKGMSSCL